MPSGQPLMIKASGKTNAKLGDRLRIALEAANAHYFDAAGQRLPLFDPH
jgi:hypothetical protein